MKTRFCLLLMMIGMTGWSQDLCIDDEMQTLFGGEHSFGAFIGMQAKMTEINGQGAVLTGGELNVIINRKLNLGFAGYGLVSDVYSNSMDELGREYFIEMGYGGLNIEPVMFSNSLVHFTVPVLLGAGGIAESNFRYTQFDYHEDFLGDLHRSDMFLFAEPGVNAELNVFKFFRVAGGVSYRWVSDVQIPTLNSATVNGWNANVALRFGWF
jgi:hypothetical protein